MKPEGPVRSVSVSSPSASLETLWVVRGAVGILAGAVLLSGLGQGAAETPRPMAVYQVFFRDQPEGIQRMVRELSSGLEDALRMRSPKDEWPTVQALSAELVPPFAVAPGVKRSHDWEFRRRGETLNYLGLPTPDGKEPAYLLLLQENFPHPPGTPLDEFHRRLNDGTVAHVGFWFHPKPKQGAGAITRPEREGWTEVIQGTAGGSVLP